MKFDRPKETEKEGTKRCIRLMEQDGWQCHRLNVSAGQFSTPGFPDYYCTILRSKLFILLEKWNPIYKNDGERQHYNVLTQNFRWVEFKRPDGGVEYSQIKRFNNFAKHDIGTWILHTEEDYKKLFKPPNWWQFCNRVRG